MRPLSVTPIEKLLVAEIITNFWRLLRARRVESELFEQSDLATAFRNQAREFDIVRRYITSIERAWHKSIEALGKEQTARRQRDNQKIGSVSQSFLNRHYPEQMKVARRIERAYKRDSQPEEDRKKPAKQPGGPSTP